MIFLLGLFLLPLDEAIPYINKIFPCCKVPNSGYIAPNINNIGLRRGNIPTYLYYADDYFQPPLEGPRNYVSNSEDTRYTDYDRKYYINFYDLIPSGYNGDFRRVILILSLDDYEPEEARDRVKELEPYLKGYLLS